MSQEKAQLIAPIDSSFTVPGLTVSGVITATSFDGTITGVADSITQGKNLNVGVVTALSFAGNLTGNAGGLIGSPNTVAGVVTGTSFIGGLTGNITGDVIGHATGVGASVKQGVNLNVGVATASTWYGDGAGLTGVGATAFIAQEVTATNSETIIDLSNGNLIYYKGNADTTVGFASTAATQELTIVRDANSNYSISYSTGGVAFDGTGDYLSVASNSDMASGTSDFTMEVWVKGDSGTSGDNQTIWDSRSSTGATSDGFSIYRSNSHSGNLVIYTDGGLRCATGTSDFIEAQWNHVAVVRKSNVINIYLNGVQSGDDYDVTNSFSNQTARIAATTVAADPWQGEMSNVRFVNGTALYDTSFAPPAAELTNITNTKLLCCQSDSSTTTAAVGPTITANGDPTAGAQTISLSGSLSATITWPDRIKWNNNTTPTLVNSTQTNASQIFRFLTADTGLTYNGWEQMETGSKSKIFSWGGNNQGQLGLNDIAKYSSPTQVGSGIGWARLLNKGASASMYDISGAIKTDNTLWVWGDNVEGELGLNDTTDRSSPTQIPGSWSTGTTGGHGQGDMMCIKTDGTLWGWGTVQVGNLGLNTPHDTMNSSPAQIGTDTNWSKVRMGKETAVGSKTDGTLWVWGANDNGVLGLNAPGTGNRSSPTQIPGTWSDSFDVGDAVSMTAVKADGTLWSWGSQSDGQLGQNEKWSPSKRGYSSPVQVGTDTTWGGAKIAHGSQSFGYVKTDGTLWMIGRNNYGKLGLNSGTDSRSSPTQVPGTTWVNVSGSYSTTIATKTDNTMWVWGENNDGSYGMSDPVAVNTARSSPIQLPGTDWDAQEEDKLAADQSVSQAMKGTA